MNVRRMVLAVTCLAVAGLGGVFAIVQWDGASRVATMVSALVAVAALGVAVWAGLPATGSSALRVTDTGKARARAGGRAVSGLTGPAAARQGAVQVERTGPADATDGGDATSGIRLT